jgi:arabinofuranan 3-O-arabinosyltransferase
MTLNSGPHALSTGEALQPDTILLSSAGSREEGPVAEAARAELPVLTLQDASDGAFTIHVHDARTPFYLSLGQNYHSTWRGSIDGQDLGPPLLLDGYSAGWYVNRTGTFTVRASYSPQHLYSFALIVSAASLVFVAMLGAAEVRRRRRRR